MIRLQVDPRVLNPVGRHSSQPQERCEKRWALSQAPAEGENDILVKRRAQTVLELRGDAESGEDEFN